MKNMIKSFGKNVKSYIDYIMTLGFKDLFRHFISLLVVILFALIIYIPIGLLSDLIINTIGSLVVNAPTIVYVIVGLVFDLIGLIAFIICFMYMFNRRYETVYKVEINKKGISNNQINYTEIKVKEEKNIVEESSIELPKEK